MKILPGGTACIEDWFKGHAFVEWLGSAVGTSLDVEMEGLESLDSVISGVSVVGIWPGRIALMGFGDEIGTLLIEVEGIGFE